MKTIDRIALGGGCHWCTEAVFQSLKGVDTVEQGWVSSLGENDTFSEAVIVHFNSEMIGLETLIEIHLHTHSSSSNHSMRSKYRSAVYFFSEEQKSEAETILQTFQVEFNNELVTQVLPFISFKASREEIQNYYQKDPNKPFCQNFIDPKLQLLLHKFKDHVESNNS